MISKETAERIWNCHREIATAKTLLSELETEVRKCGDEGGNPNPRDVFGRQKPYQLGVPSGPGSHRLYDVHPKLAVSIIRAHIAEKEADLVKANEAARLELDISSSTQG